MTRASSNDLDYLTTRLHARRERLAEGRRLDELCHGRTVVELARTMLPGVEISAIEVFQRRLVQDLAAEIFSCLKHLEADEQEFIAWLAARYHFENVKVLLRGWVSHRPPEEVQPYLIPLPANLGLDSAAFLGAKSLEEICGWLPWGSARRRLEALLSRQRNPPLFLIEGALDAGYYHELLARNNRLPGGELEIVKPLVTQEVNWFEFMLVARGRFHFGLAPEVLQPLRIFGGGELGGWFHGLLSAPDLESAVKSAAGVVVDELPGGRQMPSGNAETDLPAVEARAGERFLRLAKAAFRRSHNGVGAVAGYFGVRRMEIANLITLSEGLRLGVDEREIRGRFIPRGELEAQHA